MTGSTSGTFSSALGADREVPVGDRRQDLLQRAVHARCIGQSRHPRLLVAPDPTVRPLPCVDGRPSGVSLRTRPRGRRHASEVGPDGVRLGTRRPGRPGQGPAQHRGTPVDGPPADGRRGSVDEERRGRRSRHLACGAGHRAPRGPAHRWAAPRGASDPRRGARDRPRRRGRSSARHARRADGHHRAGRTAGGAEQGSSAACRRRTLRRTRGPEACGQARDARSGDRNGGAGTASEARRFGRPAGLVVAGFVPAVILGPPTSTFVLAVTVGAVVWLLGKQAQRGE